MPEQPFNKLVNTIPAVLVCLGLGCLFFWCSWCLSVCYFYGFIVKTSDIPKYVL